MAYKWMLLGRRLDRFFSGHWYWRLRLWLAERHLQKTLDCCGDQSIEARRAVGLYSRVRFAVQFGRAAPSWERISVRKAIAAGLCHEDVRLVVLNGEFVKPNEELGVRRTWKMVAIARILVFLSFTQWALLTVLTLTICDRSCRNVLAVGVFTIVYSVLFRGLGLYTTRPLAAGERVAKALKLTLINTNYADIIRFPKHASI